MFRPLLPRKLIGTAIAVYAIWLTVRDLQEGHFTWLILPILIAPLALWLFFVPKKLSPGKQALNDRFQAYFDAQPRAQKLNDLALWLARAAILFAIMLVYFFVGYKSGWGEQMLVLGVIGLFVSSVALNAIVISGYYRYSRERVQSQRLR